MPAGQSDPTDLRRPPPAELANRILGGWLGRIAGCNLGKPVENGDFWTPDRIRAYLEMADAYPLRDYIPALDPMPDGFQLHRSWPETTLGRVRGSARDDDIDYSILSVWLLERYGFELTPVWSPTPGCPSCPICRCSRPNGPPWSTCCTTCPLHRWARRATRIESGSAR